MDFKTVILLLFVLIMNLIAFFIMLIDKNRAGTKKERISEGQIFFWAAFMGSMGVYLGMLILHHKTRKWYFYLGIPLLIIQNLAVLILALILWP